jgi:hypothetical protein
MDTPTLREVHDLVKSRSFGPVAARTLINYSAYVAGRDPSVHIHPHVHIMAGGAGRAPDEHFWDKLDFKDEPYDERRCIRCSARWKRRPQECRRP